MYISDLPSGSPGSGAEIAFDENSATYKTGLESLYEGMTSAATSYRFFGEVEAISSSLITGSATVAGIVAAMPTYSVLICGIGALAAGERPTSSATLEIIKHSALNIVIRAYGRTKAQNDWVKFTDGSGNPDSEWFPLDEQVQKEGVTVFRKGRMRTVRLDSPSAWCATLIAFDRPSVGARVISQVYNGSTYVDCIIQVGTDGTVRVQSVWGSEIANAQYSYLVNRFITYFVD